MWIWLYRDEVVSDMSRFHGVTDILALDGPTFFALATRLPAYEGACLVALRLAKEQPQEELNGAELRELLYETPVEETQPPEEIAPEEHVMTAAELVAAGPAAPELGQLVGLFEITPCM
jgi:hypothetical protein